PVPPDTKITSDRRRNQFGCEFTNRFYIACAPAGLNPNVEAIGPAQCLQGLQEGGEASLTLPIRRNAHEHANASHALGLLRTRRERPRHRRTAEECDEFAPFHQQFLPCFEAEDSTAGDLLHCGTSKKPLSAVGHPRLRRSKPHRGACPLRSESDQSVTIMRLVAKCQKRTFAPNDVLRAAAPSH